MKYFLLFLFFLPFGFYAAAQDEVKQAATFTITKTRISTTEALLKIVATPNTNIKLFGTKTNVAKDSSWVSEVYLDSTLKNNFIDPLLEEGNFKDTFFTNEDESKSKISLADGPITWSQKIKLTDADSFKLQGNITYGFFAGKELKYLDTTLNEQFNGRKMPFVATGKGATLEATKDNSGAKEKNMPLWLLLLTGIGAGLLALITPCVYAMLPITVSFFTKKSKTKAEGIRNAFIYSASIILIFVVFGGGLSALFGPSVLNVLSTHWAANLLFFVMFIAFGISFLGAFEIQLPTKWANNTDSKANKKSISGIFFMALTLVIVSFSCTGPFIGTMITQSSAGGRLGPLVGFFGFGFGLAIPFFIFALMPSALNGLSKSGGWQNALKVTLGIIEIAFAMKFLSNVDQQFGWGLLNRDIYIAIWVVLFLVLGFYLLGKIRFSHDSELPKNDFGLPYLSVTRFSFAVASLAFALYLIPGLFGASLNAISGFLPPYGTQQFKTSAAPPATTNNGALPPNKFTKLFETQHPEAVNKYGLSIYNDYNEALAASKATGKPLFIDFTGINCVNCRKYEATLWDNPEVAKYMKDSFIVASLFTDAISSHFDLNEEEQFQSDLIGEKVTTIGQLFKHIQLELDGKLVSPAYIFVTPKGKKIKDGFYYEETAGPKDFVTYMRSVLRG